MRQAQSKEQGRGGRGRIEISAARAPADSHTGRSEAHHVGSVCGNPPSSNDKFATRLPLSDLGREGEELGEGEGEHGIHVCVCVCLSLLSLPSRGQLPTPPRTAPPSRAFHSASHPRSRKHLSLNMQ